MEADDSKNKDFLEEKKKYLNVYAKYSALGFQMFLIIGIFTYIGYRIDASKSSEVPLYTASLSLAGVFIALYLVIRSIKRLKS
ncbi:AtpZ/AtpI family protein [Pedobacter sp. SYSU D00535]|uniref:AtpZ/AtpI family protein n=1 Tax=Pedobacter sp. SYSU D00535 TaxID=2810308 RepID=UPI001A9717BF|nr:AtpZ/AtpI family protein [Pedobacter sp. SYSU D00535]